MGAYLGYLAAVLTTVSFIPQAYKTIRTKDTSGISLAMYLLFTVGVLLWFAYGVTLRDPAIYLANGLTAVFSVIILCSRVSSVIRAKRQGK
jgi:MtN3 and saliva related transmembrane protein